MHQQEEGNNGREEEVDQAANKETTAESSRKEERGRRRSQTQEKRKRDKERKGDSLSSISFPITMGRKKREKGVGRVGGAESERGSFLPALLPQETLSQPVVLIKKVVKDREGEIPLQRFGQQLPGLDLPRKNE